MATVIGLIVAVPVMLVGIWTVAELLTDLNIERNRRRRDRARRKSDADIDDVRWS